MAKPIVVLKTGYLLTLEQQDKAYKMLESKLKDYHILVIPSGSKNTEVDVFYEKDIKTTDIDKLKQMVKDSIKKPIN